jgi:amino acid transporter
VAGPEQRQDADEALLHRLGYRQELNRRISGFTNFALSFTVISILAGTLTSYYIGFGDGGPIMMSWGWPFVSLMCVVVALAMAELASAMPTAGGLYYWSSKLGSPAWGWFTGWANLVGLTIATAAVGYGLATFATALGNLWFPSTVTTTPTTIFIFYAIFMLLGGVINMYGISPVRIINNLSAWWHVIGTIVAVAVLAAVPTHHQSVAFVFTKTINASGFGGDGFKSLVFWFVIGIGLLQAQYTIGGYDASVHVSEETHNASRKAARGVWTSVAWSGVFGWILLLAVTFAIPDVDGTLKAGAFDVQYIWQRSLGNAWAEFLLFVVVAAQFFCANADVTASSRIPREELVKDLAGRGDAEADRDARVSAGEPGQRVGQDVDAGDRGRAEPQQAGRQPRPGGQVLLAGLQAGQRVRGVRGQHVADLGQLQPVPGARR